MSGKDENTLKRAAEQYLQNKCIFDTLAPVWKKPLKGHIIDVYPNLKFFDGTFSINCALSFDCWQEFREKFPHLKLSELKGKQVQVQRWCLATVFDSENLDNEERIEVILVLESLKPFHQGAIPVIDEIIDLKDDPEVKTYAKIEQRRVETEYAENTNMPPAHIFVCASPERSSEEETKAKAATIDLSICREKFISSESQLLQRYLKKMSEVVQSEKGIEELQRLQTEQERRKRRRKERQIAQFREEFNNSSVGMRINEYEQMKILAGNSTVHMRRNYNHSDLVHSLSKLLKDQQIWENNSMLGELSGPSKQIDEKAFKVKTKEETCVESRATAEELEFEKQPIVSQKKDKLQKSPARTRSGKVKEEENLIKGEILEEEDENTNLRRSKRLCKEEQDDKVKQNNKHPETPKKRSKRCTRSASKQKDKQKSKRKRAQSEGKCSQSSARSSRCTPKSTKREVYSSSESEEEKKEIEETPKKLKKSQGKHNGVHENETEKPQRLEKSPANSAKQTKQENELEEEEVDHELCDKTLTLREYKRYLLWEQKGAETADAIEKAELNKNTNELFLGHTNFKVKINMVPQKRFNAPEIEDDDAAYREIKRISR